MGWDGERIQASVGLSSRGRVKDTHVPPSGEGRRPMVPPWNSTTFLARAKPMPGALVLVAAVQALEDHEHLLLVLLGDADAVVGDVDADHRTLPSWC